MKKRILSLTLAIFFIFGSFISVSAANSYIVDDSAIVDDSYDPMYMVSMSEGDIADASKLRYEIENGEAVITGYDDEEKGKLIIPDQIDGYTVTKIGEEAFRYCYYLTEVQLPETIVFIDSYAFRHCEALKVINIPRTVTYIGNYAFSYCDIETIIIPKSVEIIGLSVFSDCPSLVNIQLEADAIPDGWHGKWDNECLAGITYGYVYPEDEVIDESSEEENEPEYSEESEETSEAVEEEDEVGMSSADYKMIVGIFVSLLALIGMIRDRKKPL